MNQICSVLPIKPIASINKLILIDNELSISTYYSSEFIEVEGYHPINRTAIFNCNITFNNDNTANISYDLYETWFDGKNTSQNTFKLITNESITIDQLKMLLFYWQTNNELILSGGLFPLPRPE